VPRGVAGVSVSEGGMDERGRAALHERWIAPCWADTAVAATAPERDLFGAGEACPADPAVAGVMA